MGTFEFQVARSSVGHSVHFFKKMTRYIERVAHDQSGRMNIWVSGDRCILCTKYFLLPKYQSQFRVIRCIGALFKNQSVTRKPQLHSNDVNI